MQAMMHIEGYYVTYDYTPEEAGDRENQPMACEVEVTEALDRNGLPCDSSLFDELADKVHARILENKWDRYL